MFLNTKEPPAAIWAVKLMSASARARRGRPRRHARGDSGRRDRSAQSSRRCVRRRDLVSCGSASLSTRARRAAIAAPPRGAARSRSFPPSRLRRSTADDRDRFFALVVGGRPLRRGKSALLPVRAVPRKRDFEAKRTERRLLGRRRSLPARGDEQKQCDRDLHGTTPVSSVDSTPSKCCAAAARARRLRSFTPAPYASWICCQPVTSRPPSTTACSS